MNHAVRIALLLAAALALPAAAAFAHSETTAGDYSIGIGFTSEPALAGMPNGLDLMVASSKTGKPVTGAEETLQAELIFGASKQKVKIEPVEGTDGAYTASVLPTDPGDYTWHVFGTVEKQAVDVSMTSSPSTFSSVVPVSDLSFPSKLPSVLALGSSVDSANRLALVGIIVGAVGVVAGIAGLVAALGRRRPGRAA
jgi:hypothetical protein